MTPSLLFIALILSSLLEHGLSAFSPLEIAASNQTAEHDWRLDGNQTHNQCEPVYTIELYHHI